jgi:hypothetical protein
MNSVKFTPGPWNREWISSALRHINKNVDYDAFYGKEITEEDNLPTYYSDGDVDLIAAAPELLEACEAAERILTIIPEGLGVLASIDDRITEAAEHCRGAMRKAHGA